MKSYQSARLSPLLSLFATILLMSDLAFSKEAQAKGCPDDEATHSELIESMDKLRETVAGKQNNRGFDATLWMQSAAEFKLITRQTYMLAETALEKMVEEQKAEKSEKKKLPLAVVLDIDETVLDNSPSQAWAVSTGKGFDPGTWDEWVNEASAKPIEGAGSYIEKARQLGVVVIYLSNREAKEYKGRPLKERTLKNLHDTVDSEATLDTIYLKYDTEHPDYTKKDDWGSEKKGRRDIVKKKYTVLQYIGDDLGDFVDGIKKYSQISPHGRFVKGLKDAQVKNKEETIIADRWGTEWFLLPNPTYGSWLRTQQDNQLDRVRPFK